jgi:hypothetical protein
MARAIFGTSPINEKKCIFSEIDKVKIGISPRVLFEKITFSDIVSVIVKPFSLIVIGRLSKSFLKMKFCFFLDEKWTNTTKEKQACDGKRLFKIYVEV